jgi:hypothetical protein
VTPDQIFNGAMIALLAMAVGYCAVIHRRLLALRASQDDFAQLIGSFNRAVGQAASGVADLKQLGVEVGATLDERIAVARDLVAKLDAASESAHGGDLATVIGSAQDRGRSHGLSQGLSQKLSLAERELASALRGVR